VQPETPSTSNTKEINSLDLNLNNPISSPTASIRSNNSIFVELNLEISDPEMLIELTAFPEGRNRQDFAMTALRIGILALKQAEGRIDAENVRNEGEKMISALQQHLSEHQRIVTQQIAHTIKEYFDPQSGRFNERLEKLLEKNGELEQVIQRQIGQDDSELAKTLDANFGKTSAIMQKLDPAASSGILNNIQQSVDISLKSSTDGILKEFTLDNKNSALSRLVTELTNQHGKLTANIQGSMNDVVGEFSLDSENSALSRLVHRVETAQKQISDEFSLDTESSALARLQREMTKILSEHKKDSAEFQQEVRESLVGMKARKDEAKRSTNHGNIFETELLNATQLMCQKSGDIVTGVGKTTGNINHCKVGDILIELGTEHIASGSKIIIEAKQSSSYDMTKAREEIETARKNRSAGSGIFVFSKMTAAEGMEPFIRLGNDIFILWDSEDSNSDIILLAAISVARALSTRKANVQNSQEKDFCEMNLSVREIEKQLSGLCEINTLLTTIKNNSKRGLKRIKIMNNSLHAQITTLDKHLESLKNGITINP
jgi:hypothetical protein